MKTAILAPKKRITARIPAEQEDRLNEASAILGLSPNAFIVQAALKEASIVIANETEIQLSERMASRMIDLIENPPKASKVALSAKESHNKLLGE